MHVNTYRMYSRIQYCTCTVSIAWPRGATDLIRALKEARGVRSSARASLTARLGSAQEVRLPRCLALPTPAPGLCTHRCTTRGHPNICSNWVSGRECVRQRITRRSHRPYKCWLPLQQPFTIIVTKLSRQSPSLILFFPLLLNSAHIVLLYSKCFFAKVFLYRIAMLRYVQVLVLSNTHLH